MAQHHHDLTPEDRDTATEHTGAHEPNFRDGTAPGAGAIQPKALSETEELSRRLETKERECSEARDRYFRLYAEFENAKKRAQRDQLDYTKYAAEKVIKDLLPVADNLERAIAHARGAGADPAIVDGLDLVVRQFQDALAKAGVEPIVAMGRPFDPALHQALAQVETAEYEAETVVEEAQRGYLLNGRILRPSLVTVARRPAGESALR